MTLVDKLSEEDRAELVIINCNREKGFKFQVGGDLLIILSMIGLSAVGGSGGVG